MILFAYHFGISLEAECKRYRFAADIFNDSAMVLDCISSAFPTNIRVALLCLSGSLRALCGVAGGGSKASLSVHFAKMGNVGELNAKVSTCDESKYMRGTAADGDQDSSQETVISLMGMLVSSAVTILRSRLVQPGWWGQVRFIRETVT
jgi:hypothetical protein